jgi:hypothetical protein
MWIIVMKWAVWYKEIKYAFAQNSCVCSSPSMQKWWLGTVDFMNHICGFNSTVFWTLFNWMALVVEGILYFIGSKSDI